MASVAIMIGGAILNAVAFTGGNYLAKYLSGVDGKAALGEKTRHGKALEAYQVTMAKYFGTAPSFLIGSKPTGTSKNKRSRTSRTLITLSNPITRHIQTGKSPRSKELQFFCPAKSRNKTSSSLSAAACLSSALTMQLFTFFELPRK